jgi:hypothetical protein
MAKTWNDFVSLVAVDVAGCPPLAIREALKEAFATFCEQSGFWAEDLEPISLSAEIADYDLSPPVGARVVTLLSATYRGTPIAAYSGADVEQDMRGWLTSVGGTPVAYQLFLDDAAQMIRLYPTPAADEDEALVVRASLKPTADATSLPDWFYEDWRMVLASGALSNLCAVPSKTWSNAELAVYHGKLFRQGITKAMARLATGGTNKVLTARPVRFG